MLDRHALLERLLKEDSYSKKTSLFYYFIYKNLLSENKNLEEIKESALVLDDSSPIVEFNDEGFTRIHPASSQSLDKLLRSKPPECEILFLDGENFIEVGPTSDKYQLTESINELLALLCGRYNVVLTSHEYIEKLETELPIHFVSRLHVDFFRLEELFKELVVALPLDLPLVRIRSILNKVLDLPVARSLTQCDLNLQELEVQGFFKEPRHLEKKLFLILSGIRMQNPENFQSEDFMVGFNGLFAELRPAPLVEQAVNVPAAENVPPRNILDVLNQDFDHRLALLSAKYDSHSLLPLITKMQRLKVLWGAYIERMMQEGLDNDTILKSDAVVVVEWTKDLVTSLGNCTNTQELFEITQDFQRSLQQRTSPSPLRDALAGVVGALVGLLAMTLMHAAIMAVPVLSIGAISAGLLGAAFFGGAARQYVGRLFTADQMIKPALECADKAKELAFQSMQP